MFCHKVTFLTAEGLILPGEQEQAAAPGREVAPVAQLAAVPALLSAGEALAALKLGATIIS